MVVNIGRNTEENQWHRTLDSDLNNPHKPSKGFESNNKSKNKLIDLKYLKLQFLCKTLDSDISTADPFKIKPGDEPVNQPAGVNGPTVSPPDEVTTQIDSLKAATLSPD